MNSYWLDDHPPNTSSLECEFGMAGHLEISINVRACRIPWAVAPSNWPPSCPPKAGIFSFAAGITASSIDHLGCLATWIPIWPQHLEYKSGFIDFVIECAVLGFTQPLAVRRGIPKSFVSGSTKGFTIHPGISFQEVFICAVTVRVTCIITTDARSKDGIWPLAMVGVSSCPSERKRPLAYSWDRSTLCILCPVLVFWGSASQCAEELWWPHPGKSNQICQRLGEGPCWEPFVAGGVPLCPRCLGDFWDGRLDWSLKFQQEARK